MNTPDYEYKIYAPTCPIENIIRYIGCTQDKLGFRLSGHISQARAKVGSKKATKKDTWILSLDDNGLKPIITEIDKTSDFKTASEKEKEFIKLNIDTVFNSGLNRKYTKNNIISDSDCGSIVITLCGDARRMIQEKQYHWIQEKKFKPRMERVIEAALDEMAEQYYKNKKQAS